METIIPGVMKLSRAEWRVFVDEQTRREVGMSLEEFEDAYATRELDLDDPDVFSLLMLLPGAR